LHFATYSGPETPASPNGLATPCKLVPGEAIANCTCYEIPAGPTFLVDINAILNLDVYLETVKTCGHDGSRCSPRGNITAPVCDAINQNTLIPGADLISTFSLYLESDYPTSNGLTCKSAPYAGCMTAPCRRGETEVLDPVTGLPLVQCACPIWSGEFQVGYPNGNACALGNNNVWSAAFAPLQELLPPPPPDRCWPDTFGKSACPLLLPKPPIIPVPPPNVSCKEVCGEYKKSSNFGVENRLYVRCDPLHRLFRSFPREPGLRGALEQQRYGNSQAGGRGRLQLCGQPDLRLYANDDDEQGNIQIERSATRSRHRDTM